MICIRCDIARGWGHADNGDSEDEGATGYGLNPPAIGFDFFQGPFADYFDGVDNDRDGRVILLRNMNVSYAGRVEDATLLGIDAACYRVGL
ncbi:MAG: hypothetical protein U5L96_15385 [Owenweeksia sp.]|nr:hypothetical protein [Owenweeksia sp.]